MISSCASVARKQVSHSYVIGRGSSLHVLWHFLLGTRDIPGTELGEASLSVLHQLRWWARKMWLSQALCGFKSPA